MASCFVSVAYIVREVDSNGVVAHGAVRVLDSYRKVVTTFCAFNCLTFVSFHFISYDTDIDWYYKTTILAIGSLLMRATQTPRSHQF